MDPVKFVEDSLQDINIRFFKGCLLQILLYPFLNTLSHIWEHCPTETNWLFLLVKLQIYFLQDNELKLGSLIIKESNYELWNIQTLLKVWSVLVTNLTLIFDFIVSRWMSGSYFCRHFTFLFFCIFFFFKDPFGLSLKRVNWQFYIA